MSEFAVTADKLRRDFGDVCAVDEIDLAIPSGEIYGFLGPNGAGKSTAMRMLTTLLLPTSGKATVAGKDVVKQPVEVRLRIGAAMQDAALDPKQTGLELLALSGRLYGLSGRDVKRRIGDLTSLIDIGDALGRQIRTYSGGMKRRLDLAASLMHSPEVLFLDEPTTGLDPISRSRIWDEVRRINRDHGVTVFLTTQYLEEADALADRVGIINRGVIAVEGTPTALKRSMGTDVIVASVEGDAEAALDALRRIDAVERVEAFGDEISVRVTNGARHISAVALALAESQVRVRELTLRTPTLDDVFLSVTGAHLHQDEAPEGSEE